MSIGEKRINVVRRNIFDLTAAKNPTDFDYRNDGFRRKRPALYKVLNRTRE